MHACCQADQAFVKVAIVSLCLTPDVFKKFMAVEILTLIEKRNRFFEFRMHRTSSYQARCPWVVAFFLPIVMGLVRPLPTLAQSAPKTWKTLDEFSAEERMMIDLRADTPRDARISYLPAESYPFTPPYTAEE